MTTLYPPYDKVPREYAEYCRAWLERMGLDLSTEHTLMTPYRMSWYVMQLLGHQEDFHFTTFANRDPRITDAVVVANITIWGACSHHLLPFFGYVDLAYIPDNKLVGLSKIPLLIKGIARGYWMQETLTHYIADKFNGALEPLGVAVRITCRHTCVMLDLDTGKVPPMRTSAIRGIYHTDVGAHQEVFSLMDMDMRGEV